MCVAYLGITLTLWVQRHGKTTRRDATLVDLKDTSENDVFVATDYRSKTGSQADCEDDTLLALTAGSRGTSDGGNCSSQR